MQLTVDPRRITLALSILAVIIIAIGFFESYSELNLDFTIPSFGFFNLDHDLTIPVWYSTVLLLTCAGLLGLIAISVRINNEPYARHWLALAIIFAYISLDEMLSLHERLTEVLQATLNTSGLLNFAWVIVGIPLVILFALVYSRFLLHLSPQIRSKFIIAGIIFVSGALGVEILGGAYLDQNGVNTGYYVLVAIEELLEMIGTIYFLYTLMAYIRSYTSVEIHIR